MLLLPAAAKQTNSAARFSSLNLVLFLPPLADMMLLLITAALVLLLPGPSPSLSLVLPTASSIYQLMLLLTNA